VNADIPLPSKQTSGIAHLIELIKESLKVISSTPRAFMRSPVVGDHNKIGSGAQLLILDEPTAALDAQTEYDVYLRFHDLTRGKTTLIISHRFSTVRMADVILVLDGGRIIEKGNHQDLISAGGEYQRLYKLQADRYK
jgi:ABC-type cobalamin transport system ATPase subunit